MTSQPFDLQHSIRFGEDFELDLRPRRLRRGSHVLKLERIPLEILILLVEHRGEIVSRETIVARVWGNDVFLDTDNSIRGAIRKIRQALKDDPETPQFIQTVTGQGYRFISPILASEEEENATEPPKPEALVVPTSLQSFTSEPKIWVQGGSLNDKEQEQRAEEGTGTETPHGQVHKRPRTWLFVGLALAAVSILSLLALRGWRGSRVPAVAQRKIVLAVLPFDNLSRDPDQEFFSDGLTEEMIAQVGKLNRDQLEVVARSSVAKYKGSTLTASEIGKELNADYLVQGRVRLLPDRVRITVELIQARDQTDVWTESYDRELKDLLAVQDSVVRSIASEIHIALTDEDEKRLATPRRVSPEAHEAYLKGRPLLLEQANRREHAEGGAVFRAGHRQRTQLCGCVFGTGRLQQRPDLARI